MTARTVVTFTIDSAAPLTDDQLEALATMTREHALRLQWSGDHWDPAERPAGINVTWDLTFPAADG